MHRISILTLLILSASVVAADFTKFRGSAAGHAAIALPQKWSADSNIAWRTEIKGEGWSSPVIDGQRVYVTAAIPNEENSDELQLSLLAFSTKDGSLKMSKPIFTQAADAPKIHRKNSHASPTPIIANKRIYVHFGHQGTACLDLQGNILWQRVIEYPPVHGNGGSPVLVDGKLIFSVDAANDAYVIALDANSGDTAWKTSRESVASRKFSFSTPLVITVNNRKQVISPGSDVVCSYDITSGEEIWRVAYDGYSVIPKPVFAHGLVYICTGYGRPKLLAIRPDGKGNVTESHVAWKSTDSVPHTPSLMIVKDELYMVSDRGIASCLDAKTGERHWRERIGGAFSASPVFSNGLIYLLDEAGKTTVFRASTEFERVAENDLGERALASFGIGDKGLFIRTADALYRIK